MSFKGPFVVCMGGRFLAALILTLMVDGMIDFVCDYIYCVGFWFVVGVFFLFFFLIIDCTSSKVC